VSHKTNAKRSAKDASAVGRNKRTRPRRRWGGEYLPRRSDLARDKRRVQARDSKGSTRSISRTGSDTRRSPDSKEPSRDI
jgi:hypothetical protein